MRSKADGAPVRPATVNMYVAAVKSFLGFAHRVGFTRFNAAPLIKLKKAPRQVAQRILGELDVRDLIKHTKGGRDRLMLQVAYFGDLRVSELVSLTWAQVIRRDSGEAQLSVVGKGRQGPAGTRGREKAQGGISRPSRGKRPGEDTERAALGARPRSLSEFEPGQGRWRPSLATVNMERRGLVVPMGRLERSQGRP